MTTVVDHPETRVGNLSMEPLAETERDKFIVPAPNEKRRPIDHAESVIEYIISAYHRVKELADSVAVPSGHSLLKDNVNVLIEALVVKCQRTKISNIFAARQTKRTQSVRIHGFCQRRVACRIGKDKAFDSFWMLQCASCRNPGPKRIANYRGALDFQFAHKAIKKIDKGADTTPMEKARRNVNIPLN